MVSIVAFAVAGLLGYVVFSRYTGTASFSFFFSHATVLEAKWRDRLFLPLTRRMTAVPPNAVTLAGFVLTLALLYLFWVGASFPIIFLGILLAGFTDMLDGPLARNNNRVTALGARLDWTRDLLLTIVTGASLVRYGLLETEFLLWFLVGWVVLGILRVFEFKAAGGTVFNADEDYKFILDRVRLLAIWAGGLLLVLTPLYPMWTQTGEALVVSAIIMSWFSVLIHAAHLKTLRAKLC